MVEYLQTRHSANALALPSLTAIAIQRGDGDLSRSRAPLSTIFREIVAIKDHHSTEFPFFFP
jgi:hypothetical protein